MYTGPAVGFVSHAAAHVTLDPLDHDDLCALADVVAGRELRFERGGDRIVVHIDGAEPRAMAAALIRA